MKIAITSTGPTLDNEVEARFGRCAYFLVVDTDTMQFTAIENPNSALGGGAGIQSAALLSQSEVSTVLTGNCGPNAFNVFGQAGIRVIIGVSGTVRNAVDQFNSGQFSAANGPNVQSHFGVGAAEQPEQALPFGAANPGMGNPGMGGGGGKGRGMGGGRGMGRGMGMGMKRPMDMPVTGRSSGLPEDTGSPTPDQELAALKQQAEMLEQQKQQLNQRINRLEGGRKAVAHVQTKDCTGCGICADVCPNNAISIDTYAVVNCELCTACAVCVSECPNGAIIISQ